MKSVLISAGNVKREKISKIKEDLKAKGEAVDEAAISEGLDEQQVGLEVYARYFQDFPPLQIYICKENLLNCVLKRNYALKLYTCLHIQ